MNPLEPDIHGTGKWTFRGKNLPPDEVETLTKRGVDWQKDIMPDGRLKHPRLRRRAPVTKTTMSPSLSPDELEEKDAKRRADYLALPEPRPDYFEWAANEERMDQFAELYRIARTAGRTSDRIKASAILLEFSKSKPKQQIEVKEQAPAQPMSPDKLLGLALELNGYDPAVALTALKKTAN